MFGLAVSLLLFAAPLEPAGVPLPLLPVDDLYERVLTYKRSHVAVRPLHRPWVTPMTLNPIDESDEAYLSPGFNQSLPTLAPMPTDAVGEWGIVRGSAEVLDDMDLADLLRDQPLRDHIAAERFWPRLWWGVGFGAVSAAALGTGGYMTWRDYDNGEAQRNGQAIGISLLAVGAATGLLAALYPAYAQHVLTAPQAAAACDQYNEVLRHELRLAPEDLQRF